MNTNQFTGNGKNMAAASVHWIFIVANAFLLLVQVLGGYVVAFLKKRLLLYFVYFVYMFDRVSASQGTVIQFLSPMFTFLG